MGGRVDASGRQRHNPSPVVSMATEKSHREKPHTFSGMDANQSAVYSPVEPGPDRAAAYAEQVRQALQAASAPLSVKELLESCSLSERLVRDGLERLIFSGAVVMTKRYVARRRGPPPLVYSLRQP